MQKKVLIVEDEYDIASTMELILDMENHEVRLCSNGKEALDILNNEALPNLIITDIMMPVMDGYEFLREVRKQKRFESIPILLSSAAPLNKQKLDESHYNGFIRKPFELDGFLQLVEKVLKKSR